jgi:hypothetical protein
MHSTRIKKKANQGHESHQGPGRNGRVQDHSASMLQWQHLQNLQQQTHCAQSRLAQVDN